MTEPDRWRDVSGPRAPATAADAVHDSAALVLAAAAARGCGR